jgi:acyl transferase domain-containing protein
MDPQHRILLEVGWEAMENAGRDPEMFSGSIGVFATCGMNSYMMRNLLPNRRIMETVGEWLVRHTGNDMNFLATRLSYELNLKGPSMNVQTACSSALVAIHQASQSLLSGECDMAMAGGCTLSFPLRRGYFYKPGEILSPDGHCRPFDARAAGTVFGSGAGMVVLRRLSDALDGGDHIQAVILGSAVNNDGSMKVGYLAPSVEGQAKAVTEALAASGVDPESISFVEAHGTGTHVGDPIEVAALTQAYRRFTRKKGFCALGSVKSNIGHLGEAAGAAGFIKTVLSLKNRQIPPTLHFERPNPEIEFGDSPFFVNTKTVDWTSAGMPRRAGVTALGAGGTNCHVVVEEAPSARPSEASLPWQLLTLSAVNPAALDAATANLAAHLKENRSINLADAAFTLNLGRKAFDHRRTVVCRDVADAIAALESTHRFQTAQREKADPSVAFLFTGQGAQYPKMGWELYQHQREFRETVNECAAILKPELGVDLCQVLYGSSDSESMQRALRETALAQPALFAVEYAMAKLWMSWGVKPQAMLGHSIGEYTAACLAGVFSLEDALALVASRGRLMQAMPLGTMLAVALPEAEVIRHMNGKGASGRLSLAAVNAPSLAVVAGLDDAVSDLKRTLSESGVECQTLHTSHAFHSSMMDPILEPFREKLQRIRLRPPSIPFPSNVTGEWIRAEEATSPEYWVQHLRKPVRFAEGASLLLRNPNQILLEVGPGRTLSSLVRQQPVKPLAALTSMRAAKEDSSDLAVLLDTCGRMWSMGVPIDWKAFWSREARQRVPLPSYPFQRKSYWIEPDEAPIASPAAASPAALRKRADIAEWFYAPCWKRSDLHAEALKDSSPKQSWLVFTDEAGLGDSLIPRLVRSQGARPRRGLRLTATQPGEVDGLKWIPETPQTPGPGEVEIEVRATALNFADVLKVTGAFPEAPFGMELAGVIASVGEGVREWKAGDEVVAIGPESHATRVIRDARFVALKPQGLSFEAAVALPAAYMTAWHALTRIAGLKAGERILIHAASEEWAWPRLSGSPHRSGNIRDRWKPRKARLPGVARYPACLQLSDHRVRGHDSRTVERSRGRRRAQFADRRIHPEESGCSGRWWTFS